MRARPSRVLLTAALVVLPLAVPASLRAQLSVLQAFARNVTDLSFYLTRGGLAGGSPELSSGPWGLNSYGVELLFSVGEVSHPLARPGGRDARARADTAQLVWKGMQVTHHKGEVDTVYTYDVQKRAPRPPPADTVWYMEMGIGYGQMQGFRMKNPSLALYGAIRDLPAVSLYVSYDPTGTYLGVRTGFMKTQSLQVIDQESGNTFSGSADAFLFGAVVGEAVDLETLSFFVEGGYMRRAFPSVEWNGPSAVPTGVPMKLNVSNWSISTGVQFSLR